MELVLFRFTGMENLHVAVLHSHGQPVTSWAVTQTENLTAEVMLLKLSSLPEVPGPHSVVQPPSPELGAVSRDINAAGPVCVALELSDQSLVVEVPHCNVPVTETTLSLAPPNTSEIVLTCSSWNTLWSPGWWPERSRQGLRRSSLPWSWELKMRGPILRLCSPPLPPPESSHQAAAWWTGCSCLLWDSPAGTGEPWSLVGWCPRPWRNPCLQCRRTWWGWTWWRHRPHHRGAACWSSG